MGLRILTPARFFSSMSWLRILALVACYVSVTRSSTSYDDGDTAAGALPVGRGPLECFRGSCRRSRRRHQAVGSNASQSDCCGLRSCGDLAGRRTSDSDAGHACGVGLQIGEENLLDQQWRRMARVGGPQPLGDHQRRQREKAGGRAGGNPENQEVETKQHLGPDGRFGVHGGARGGQTEMAEEIQGDHGGISPGRGGADAGTSIGDQEEGGWRSSTFCGLLHLCALRKAGNEDSQVQELPVRSFDGGLHGKGTPGAKFLRDVALVLQSLQGFFGDAGLGGIHHLEPLREPHGKTVEDVRRGLAFAGNGRREGQRRAIVKSEVEDCNRPGRRKGCTSGMVGEEAVELRPVVGAGGREVLERASSHTRLGLVGYGGKRLAPDPRREVHAGHSFGRQEPRRSPERVGEHGGRKWKKEIEQREKGGSKEEGSIRKGGARKMEKQRWRKRRKQRRWEERKRKERGEMLLLELWFRSMQRFGRRGEVQGCGDQDPQLFEVWITRTSGGRVRWCWLGDLWLATMVFLGKYKVAWEEEPQDGKKKKRKNKNPGGWVDGPGMKRKGQDQYPSDDENDRKKKERKKGDGGDKDGSGNGSQEDYAEEATTAEEYLKRRCFLFIHHFAGKNDPLGAAVREAAAQRNLKVTVLSVDIENGTGDLSEDEPYLGHLKMAKAGLVDGFHAGFPCTTFTRLKFREAEGYPGPVRTATYPYGVPGLTEKRKEQCDRGTVFASRSAKMATAVLEAPRETTIKPCSTLENPPPSDVEGHLSAWELRRERKRSCPNPLKGSPLQRCRGGALVSFGCQP